MDIHRLVLQQESTENPTLVEYNSNHVGRFTAAQDKDTVFYVDNELTRSGFGIWLQYEASDAFLAFELNCIFGKFDTSDLTQDYLRLPETLSIKLFQRFTALVFCPAAPSGCSADRLSIDSTRVTRGES
jgi:hypothetical protein